MGDLRRLVSATQQPALHGTETRARAVIRHGPSLACAKVQGCRTHRRPSTSPRSRLILQTSTTCIACLLRASLSLFLRPFRCWQAILFLSVRPSGVLEVCVYPQPAPRPSLEFSSRHRTVTQPCAGQSAAHNCACISRCLPALAARPALRALTPRAMLCSKRARVTAAHVICSSDLA